MPRHEHAHEMCGRLAIVVQLKLVHIERRGILGRPQIVDCLEKIVEDYPVPCPVAAVDICCEDARHEPSVVDIPRAKVAHVLIFEHAGPAPNEISISIVNVRTCLAWLIVIPRMRLLFNVGIRCNKPIPGCNFTWFMLVHLE